MTAKVGLIRQEMTEHYTLGTLIVATHGYQKLIGYTIEPPWKDNQRNISCIPAGVYIIRRYYSEKYKCDTYRVLDVPDRDAIVFHVGNRVWNPVTNKGDTKGCICPGERIVRNNKTNQWNEIVMVYPSKPAFERFRSMLDADYFDKGGINNEYTLIITEIKY